ncbi:siderophore ABC transporter substrate-binding protein [Neisseria chenwenguii]|uniref:Iron ABC transporter substrate-binding protein n=1 Tax=Neisseria chenwenguii TaxID=1853278 RepID=A0A220S099_9NEIS|nr:siderophore ABC transporter substrate-binding protein [Neisseria chenwenguii]ASK26901.1 iron ABC transporter substrate-binding protein [Neisseria chenwenguii]ROV56697.1 siderophore ABC transporter substrate-binding protein [Neisseria chenwenguii]
MLRLSAITLCCALALTACKPQEQKPAASAPASAVSHKIDGPSVSVKTARGEVTVPQKPERIAVYDLGMTDTLTKLGVPVGATVDKTRLPYLDAAFKDSKKVGTLFEPNYEALNAYKPQLIIIGSRAAKAFDQLNAIAPTIEMTADTKNLKESGKERIDAFAKIFGKEAEAEKLKAEIDASFEAAKTAAQGKGKGLVILANAGKLSAYGPTSRLGGWIHKDIGVPPVDEAIKEGSHGQPVSFEYLKEKNPDWLFVLDRGAAIGEEGKAAKDVLNNPLVAETTAWKKGRVVYLVPETYLAAGGAQELLNASKQVADAFKAAK